ncbi:MAG: L,D-transpeptidase family protein [Planctomycetes bacterium]|nr:L,D-transpeptidase family protein [Planctomycetota bacterium]
MKQMVVVLVLLAGGGYFAYSKGYLPWKPAGKVVSPGTGGGSPTDGGKGGPQAPADPVQLFEAGRYAEALEPLKADLKEQEAKKGPEVVRDLYCLGVACDELGKGDEAIAYLARLDKEFPDSKHAADALLRLSRLAKDPDQRENSIGRLYREFAKAPGVAAAAAADAERLLKDGKEWEAWLALSGLMRQGPAGAEREKLAARMEPIVKKFLFSAVETPGSVIHVVQSKELLDTIRKKYGVTAGLIQRTNGLTSDRIFPNQRLKIVKGKADMEVLKSAFRLTLYYANRWVSDYPIGIGVLEKSPTPTGTFTIGNKLVDPPWKNIAPGNPNNILGTRWMGFVDPPDYGIHGTTKPETIGTPSSNGCVRMKNEHVEHLYDFVTVGSRVVISN